MEQLDTKSRSHRESNKAKGRKKTKQKENLAVNKMEAKKRPRTRNAKRGRGKSAGTAREGKKQKAVQDKKEDDALIYVQGVCDASLYEYEYVEKREDGSKSNISAKHPVEAHKDNDGVGRQSQKALPIRFPKKRAGRKNVENGNATKRRKNAKSASVKKGHGILGNSKKKEEMDKKKQKASDIGSRQATLPVGQDGSSLPSGARKKGDGTTSNTSTWNTLSHEDSNAENRARPPVLYAKNETKPFHTVGPFRPVSGFGVPILPEVQRREQ
jgi:hypothetical protein